MGTPALPALRPARPPDPQDSQTPNPRRGTRMARVLITGSSDGLGLMAGQLLVRDGHEVTLHGRNEARAEDARAALPVAAHVVVGDLASLNGMHQVAEQASKLGRHDAVI